SPAEAAATVNSRIKEMNVRFGITEKFDFIERGDIKTLAAYADREANPLYPVPELWNAKQLEKIYLKVGGYAD
ncbi:MAG: alcohol dehydrogenase, partial [Clostridia bacterium]|nr:alcohol dehydrogenase [Clostridia bacterium]